MKINDDIVDLKFQKRCETCNEMYNCKGLYETQAVPICWYCKRMQMKKFQVAKQLDKNGKMKLNEMD